MGDRSDIPKEETCAVRGKSLQIDYSVVSTRMQTVILGSWTCVTMKSVNRAVAEQRGADMQSIAELEGQLEDHRTWVRSAIENLDAAEAHLGGGVQERVANYLAEARGQLDRLSEGLAGKKA